METVTFQVAKDVMASPAISKIMTYRSAFGILTLAIPVEFIWFGMSQDPKYANSPKVDVEIPRLRYGTLMSFYSGELTASTRLYADDNSKGEIEEDSSSEDESLYYIEFMAAIKVGCGAMVKVFRSSGMMMNVVEYLEMRNSSNLGTDLTISTRYFDDILYTTLSDSSGNFFEVVDNRDLSDDTKNLIEYNAFVFENQKLLSFEDAKEIMDTGYLDFLFGRG